MILDWLPMVFTTGWASGINSYGLVLLLGLAGRFFSVDAVPELLTRPEVLIAAAVLLCLEEVADKIPYVDVAWSSVHTAIRPVIGGALGSMMAGDVGGWDKAFAAATGGSVALVTVLSKVGIRLALNASPEPVSTIVASVVDDLVVAGTVLVSLTSPWVAAGIALALLIAAAVLALLLLRMASRGLARARERWREGGFRPPRAAATPDG